MVDGMRGTLVYTVRASTRSLATGWWRGLLHGFTHCRRHRQVRAHGCNTEAAGDQFARCRFSEAESLSVLAAILARPPRILALDPTFVATSRGATLVARLKADSHASGIELRVLIEDEAKVPLLLSQPAVSAEKALLQTSRPLDRAGTRRAARFPMNRRAVLVNGEHSHLVDLSVTGAQVLAPMRLRPTQTVRLTLSDGSTETRCQGTIAWSVAVPTGAVVHYRAGLEFINPDTTRLAAYCTRFGGSPNPTFGAT